MRKENFPTTGMEAIALMLTSCDELLLYGFVKRQNASRPYHYWRHAGDEEHYEQKHDMDHERVIVSALSKESDVCLEHEA